MSWTVETDISKFLQRHQEKLLEREAENNFLLQALTHSIQSSPSQNLGLFDGDQTIGFLYNGTLLFNSTQNNTVGDLVSVFSQQFGNDKARKLVPKIFAPENLAQNFTRSWLQWHKGLRIEKQFSTLLHKLTHLNATQKSEGQFRRAWLEELNLLAEWYKNFWIETKVGNDSRLSAEEIILQMINSKQLFVWGNHRPSAMASVSGSTPKGIRINCVYTPREKRGHGFAKSVVSSLVDLQLSQGKEFVVLFTDLLRPENAALYSRIGFEELGGYLNYQFSS